MSDVDKSALDYDFLFLFLQKIEVRVNTEEQGPSQTLVSTKA